MKNHIFWVKNFLSVSLLFCFLGSGLNLFPETKIEVKVTAPGKNGIKIGKEMDVKGTAVIPSGNYLWVLIHRIKGFKRVWWPQGEAEIDPKTSEWEGHVVFGGPQDIGFDFEIAVIVVNKEEDSKLQNYRLKAMRENHWPPIPMPPTVSPPTIRRVNKTNHD